MCVCAGECVPLQACFDTRHLLSDGKLHAWLWWTLMPALRRIFHGILREDLSFATCPQRIPEWTEISVYYPPPFLFFLGALTRDTVRSWRNLRPFSCASSYGPSSKRLPSVSGPAPRSTGSQKPPWSAGDRCTCTSPRFQPLRSPTRWSQMERCSGTKTSPSLPWLARASLGTTAPLGLGCSFLQLAFQGWGRCHLRLASEVPRGAAHLATGCWEHNNKDALSMSKTLWEERQFREGNVEIHSQCLWVCQCHGSLSLQPTAARWTLEQTEWALLYMWPEGGVESSCRGGSPELLIGCSCTLT